MPWYPLQAQRTQHQHGKPIGRYSADGGMTSSGHQTMSRAMMENVGMHSKAACPSPSSGASLIRNASFDRWAGCFKRKCHDLPGMCC